MSCRALDNQGTQVSLTDGRTLLSSMDYFSQYLRSLYRTSDARFPVLDGVVYAGEGVEVKHIYLAASTSNINDCQRAPLAYADRTQPCKPLPSVVSACGGVMHDSCTLASPPSPASDQLHAPRGATHMAT